MLASCIKEEPAPQGIIPKDTMVGIMTDIHIAEAKISVRNLQRDSALIYYSALSEEILKKYHISRKRLEESMNYYSRNPKKFYEIEEHVVDSLSLREARGKVE